MRELRQVRKHRTIDEVSKADNRQHSKARVLFYLVTSTDAWPECANCAGVRYKNGRTYMQAIARDWGSYVAM